MEPTKKCPYCFSLVLTDATRCDVCKKRLGPRSKSGLAEKPVDWLAYITATIGISALSGFLYWLFFLKEGS